jgi:hypothetical protein
MVSVQELVLTLIGLVSVVIVPALAGLATGVRRGSTLTIANVVAAVIALFWAVYWAALANPHHIKHTVLFVVLAGVALVAASFSRPTALA